LDGFGAQKKGLYGRKSECRSCLSEKEAARRAADPEAARAYKREWWAANPQSDDEKAKSALKARTWYAENMDRARGNMSRWLNANRDAYNVIQARRRARKAEVLNTLTFDEWSEILESFNHACAYCLCTDLPLAMDHVIPISKNGPHTAENIAPACKPCNSRKYNRRIFTMLRAA
jgi:5-methylcytosine-specific restriction endonuclease McrA